MGVRGQRGVKKTAVNHTEASIQKALWLRKPIVAKPQYEMLGFLAYAWESDYLAITKSGYVYEVEIKVSHADFLNEARHKERKMRLLGGEAMTEREFYNIDVYSDSPMTKPNFFYYVCPEGVIKPDEVPDFAGLLYITDDGWFRGVKSAPQLHREKHSFSAEYLRDKYYWAMWNWIQRNWRYVVKDISGQAKKAYEKALDDAAERISDLENENRRLKNQ